MGTPNVPERVGFRIVYDEGHRDRATGKPHTHNPYKSHEWKYEAWLRGWGGQPDKRISETLKR